MMAVIRSFTLGSTNLSRKVTRALVSSGNRGSTRSSSLSPRQQFSLIATSPPLAPTLPGSNTTAHNHSELPFSTIYRPPPCARRNSRDSHCPRFSRADNVFDLSPYQHSDPTRLNRRRDAQWNIACQPLTNMNIRVTCLGGKNFENSGNQLPCPGSRSVSLTWKEVNIFLRKDSQASSETCS